MAYKSLATGPPQPPQPQIITMLIANGCSDLPTPIGLNPTRRQIPLHMQQATPALLKATNKAMSLQHPRHPAERRSIQPTFNVTCAPNASHEHITFVHTCGPILTSARLSVPSAERLSHASTIESVMKACIPEKRSSSVEDLLQDQAKMSILRRARKLSRCGDVGDASRELTLSEDISEVKLDALA